MACEEFNKAILAEDDDESDAPLGRLIRPPVVLYCKVLSTHPFLDGNGRVAFVLLQYALIRNHLLAVALEDFEDHQWALGVALRKDGKQSYVEMEQLLADKISTASF